jgi:hypothetical protein
MDDGRGTLLGGDISTAFTIRHWSKHVVPAMGTLPGSLAALFTDYATKLYTEWVREIVAGVTDPKRRLRTSVVIGGPGSHRHVSHEAFFAKYMGVRRNTLHGYDLSRGNQDEYLRIHDDRLPFRIAEWGRLQFITLLAEPDLIFRRLRALPT